MCVYVFEMISIRVKLIDMTLRSRRLMGHLIGQMGKKSARRKGKCVDVTTNVFE